MMRINEDDKNKSLILDKCISTKLPNFENPDKSYNMINRNINYVGYIDNSLDFQIHFAKKLKFYQT